MIAGITVLPVRSTRRAPAGALTAVRGPTCVILPPSTTNAAFSMGARPSPTIRRAPSNTVAPVDDCVCPVTGAEWARRSTPITTGPATTATRREAIFRCCIDVSSAILERRWPLGSLHAGEVYRHPRAMTVARGYEQERPVTAEIW